MKTMKRIMATALALVFFISLCACNSSNITDSKSLHEHGLDVIDVMVEMTRNNEYVDIYTGSTEIKTVVQKIAKGNFDKPKAVYKVSMQESDLLTMAQISDVSGISKELTNTITQRVFATLVTQLNGFAGVHNLAASSVCSAGKTFVSDEISTNHLYVYTYENAVPVAVTFTIGEDNTVSASGMFILYEDFTCNSAQEIKEFFSEMPMEVTESEMSTKGK